MVRGRRRSALRSVLVSVLGFALVAGCGGDDGGGGDGAAGDTTTTTAIATTAFSEAAVERGDDGSLTISWAVDGDAPVDVAWGTDPDAIDEALATVEDDTSVTVDDPAPGGRAYFRLASGDAEVIVAERRVPLEGVANFRDLGGYETEDGRHVRWGQVFRSGALVDLTPADVATVEDLGIALVCDLRSDSEVEEDPDPDVGAEELRLAVTDESTDVQAITDAVLAGDLDAISPDLLLEGMPLIATEFPDAWSAMIERLADEANRPTVVHCTAGKDRAGWASALTLRAVGVPEETVMEDYLLSSDYLAESNAATIAQVRTNVAGVQGVPEDEVDMSNLEALLEVRPEYLQAAFDAVEEQYGDFDTYLTEGLGLDQATIDQLRDQLLE
jgi:protein-tyrosine phosphatase